MLGPLQTGKVGFSAEFWWFSLVESYMFKQQQAMLCQLLLFSTKTVVCAPGIIV